MPFKNKDKDKHKKKKPKKVNIDMEYVPPKRFKKPIPEAITIIKKGFGTKKYIVKRISSEEILLPDGTLLFTGVPPQPEQFKSTSKKDLLKEKVSKYVPFWNFSAWNIVSMNYAYEDHPFTIFPQNQKPITSEAMLSLLIDQKVCIPVHISASKTIYVLMYRFGEKAGQPVFKDKMPKDLYDKLNPENGEKPVGKEQLQIFFDWIDDNKEKIKDMKIADIPVKTHYDVTEIEVIRSSFGQVVYGGLLTAYAKAQDRVGDSEVKPLFLMLAIGGFMLATMIIMLYAASEGVVGA